MVGFPSYAFLIRRMNKRRPLHRLNNKHAKKMVRK